MLKTSLAKAQHSMWNIKLSNYLRNQDLTCPDQVIVDAKACYLGRWLAGQRVNGYYQKPALVELSKVHQRLHQQAQLIVQLKQEGQLVEANAQLLELSKTSDYILELLDRVAAETLA